MAIVLDNLSGGLNVYDSPTDLPKNQTVIAQNVLWSTAKVAVRRLGYQANTAWNNFGLYQAVLHGHRHLPSGVASSSELYLNVVASGQGNGNFSFVLADGAFHTLTPADAAPVAAGSFSSESSTASSNKKCFVAYDSAVDRMHIQAGGNDPSTVANTVRRTGIAEPAALTSVVTSGSGSYAGTRYFRTRNIYQVSSVIYNRSEPSVSTSFNPPGTGAGATLTRPSVATGEQVTHWEVEASDDDADFYRIATVAIATTTYTDTINPATAYATNGVLSEDEGDYGLQWSAKYVIVDEDRVLIAGAFDTVAYQSRVAWTPVFTAPGVGNNERIPADPVSYVDLDAGDGGEITGMVGPVNNVIYVFKQGQIYKLTRSYNPARAYFAVPISKKIGALEGSIVEGVDETGAACIYFTDPFLGLHRVGQFGLQFCGQDVWPNWDGIHLDALVPVRSFFFPTEGQLIMTFATGSSDIPDTCLVFNTEHGHTTEQGDVRGGWTEYTGTPALIRGSFMYAADINAASRSARLVPFHGFNQLTTNQNSLMQGNIGNTDNGTGYRAYLRTRPVVAGETILQKTGATAGMFLGPPASGATLGVAALADFDTWSVTKTIDLTPNARELSRDVSRIFRLLDSLSIADCKVIQAEIGDPDATGETFWQVDRLDIGVRREESLG